MLAGWVFDVGGLKRVFPGLVAMNPVSAVAFVLSGASLFLPVEGRDRALSWGLALIVVLVGLLGLGVALSGQDIGADHMGATRMGTLYAELQGAGCTGDLSRVPELKDLLTAEFERADAEPNAGPTQ